MVVERSIQHNLELGALGGQSSILRRVSRSTPLQQYAAASLDSAETRQHWLATVSRVCRVIVRWIGTVVKRTIRKAEH